MLDAHALVKELSKLWNQVPPRCPAAPRPPVPAAVTYAQNYARGHPKLASFQPPPANESKKNPSISPRLTEGFSCARVLDRPVC